MWLGEVFLMILIFFEYKNSLVFIFLWLLGFPYLILFQVFNIYLIWFYMLLFVSLRSAYIHTNIPTCIYIIYIHTSIYVCRISNVPIYFYLYLYENNFNKQFVRHSIIYLVFQFLLYMFSRYPASVSLATQSQPNFSQVYLAPLSQLDHLLPSWVT